MRYTILGFNQEKVCSIFKEVKIDGVRSKIYKLDVIDLVILQEIADFMDTRGKDPNMVLGIDLNIANPDYTSLFETIIKDKSIVNRNIPTDYPNAYFWMKAFF